MLAFQHAFIEIDRQDLAGSYLIWLYESASQRNALKVIGNSRVLTLLLMVENVYLGQPLARPRHYVGGG
jgi:hypothetical protein